MLQNPYPKGTNIQNLKLPLSVDIPGGLTIGRKIYITGTIPPKTLDFQINFVTTQNFNAFHINPRFKQNQIIRNTDKGGWGKEETNGSFPFKHNNDFEMIITIHGDEYKVAVDGKHVFDYRHRVGINEISKLHINGEITLKSLMFSIEDIPKGQFTKLELPAVVPIIGGLQVGKLFQIEGTVPDGASRFGISLQATSENDASYVAFQFYPFWDSKNSNVILNFCKNGIWGNEETAQLPFPFKRGKPFEIFILCDIAEWKVAVNGKHYVSYPHKFPIKIIDHIRFHGDVVINIIRQFN